jgi:hypothetical protein
MINIIKTKNNIRYKIYDMIYIYAVYYVDM